MIVCKMNFKNKVVIVTGASSGIGAATAEAFSTQGAKVIMVGRNEAKLAAVAKKCKDPLIIRADVANDDDARRIVDQTINKYGQIDVLVNNAGTGHGGGELLDGGLIKSYDYIMNTNLRAVIHITSLAAPYLVTTKGNVINISSVVGKIPPFLPGFTNYHVSKAGLDHFTRCAAAELGPYGVRVNAISPGPIVTDFLENVGSTATWDDIKKMTILNRVSPSEEISNLILFLAGDKAVSITGSDFVNDNGMMLKRV